MMKALRTGSGYYIDVGASDLIAKGEIERQKRRRDPPRQRALRRAHATARELPADLIVYGDRLPVDEPRGGARSFREEVADKVGQVLGARLRHPAATRALGGRAAQHVEADRSSRASGFTAAISHLSRHYSLVLALQIKARMEGLPTPVYGLQKSHHKC